MSFLRAFTFICLALSLVSFQGGIVPELSDTMIVNGRLYGVPFGPMNARTLENLKASLIYFGDDRTGLCFAAVAVYPMCIGDECPGRVSITNVPCEGAVKWKH